MTTKATKQERRIRRKKRIRAKVSGTSTVPRLSIFRSNTAIYGQLIDDVNAVTLASSDDTKITSGTKVERARKAGEQLAERAQAKKITKIVFDRGGYAYMGRVKAFAEGARSKGLKF